MALKKLSDTQKEDAFIAGAKVDGKAAVKAGKPVKNTFSKQTINLDEKRYLKITAYCKRRKITFQSFMIERIDEYFQKRDSTEA